MKNIIEDEHHWGRASLTMSITEDECHWGEHHWGEHHWGQVSLRWASLTMSITEDEYHWGEHHWGERQWGRVSLRMSVTEVSVTEVRSNEVSVTEDRHHWGWASLMWGHWGERHLLKRFSFLHCIFLPPLSKVRCPHVCGFISGLSILFRWSIFLSLCQYHTVLMTVALSYSLKSGSLIPPVAFCFLKIALAIWGFLCFHENYEIICSSSGENIVVSLIGIALNL